MRLEHCRSRWLVSLRLLIVIGVPGSQPVPGPYGAYKKESFLPIPTNNYPLSPNSRFKIELVKRFCRTTPLASQSIFHHHLSQVLHPTCPTLPYGPGLKAQSPTSTGGVIAKSQGQAYPLDPQPLSSKTRSTASTKAVGTAASCGSISMKTSSGGVIRRLPMSACQPDPLLSSSTIRCMFFIKVAGTMVNCGSTCTMEMVGGVMLEYPALACRLPHPL